MVSGWGLKDEGKTGMTNRKYITATISLWILSAVVLLLSRERGLRYEGMDFYQYWSVGRFLGGMPENLRETIYQPEATGPWESRVRQEYPAAGEGERWLNAARYRQNLEIYSSPFLYALFIPFCRLPYSSSLDLFQALSLLCVFVFAVSAGGSLHWKAWAIPLVLLFFFGVFHPGEADLRTANVNRLQLAGIGLLMFILSSSHRNKFFVAGIFSIILAAFKPNLIFILIMLCGGLWAWRRWNSFKQFLIGCIVGGAVACGAAWLVWGSFGCWETWFLATVNMPAEIIPPRLGNFSLSWHLSRMIGMDVSLLLAVFISGIVLSAIILGAHRAKKSPRRLAEVIPALVAIGPLIFILSSRLVWIHYYVLCLPAGMVLLAPFTSKISKYAGFFGLLLVGLDPVLVFFPRLGLYRETIIMVLGAAILFLALMRVIIGKKLHRSRGTRAITGLKAGE